MKDIKYTSILAANRVLAERLQGQKKYTISVLSNIITNQLSSILEYVLRSKSVNAELTMGDYDNIVQDSEKYSKSDAVVIFWELANLMDGLHYKANILDSETRKQLIQKTISEIQFVFKNLADTPVVLINKFSSLAFNYPNIRADEFDRMGDELNSYLIENLPDNFVLIDIDRVISTISIKDSIDLRYFYSSKALYTVSFFKEYSNFIAPVFLSVNGKSKKALIFDCDNTLWKGIVGEDGIEGIELSSVTKTGTIFEEIHHLALDLADKGVILGLCSKNNAGDVTEVFDKRKDLVLRPENIVVSKVNWNDKASNLKDISSELNIGIDSIVFIDDSDFEINFIAESLPNVNVIQVPERLYDYPTALRENLALFYNHSNTSEDKARTSMYKAELNRNAQQEAFGTLDEYLSSLKLVLQIQVNQESLIPRLAQLTQKTNQFNLTTKRYTATELSSMMRSGETILFSFSLTDKFGDYGTTGLSIVHIDGSTAQLDTFLMSCRVIGRNIEVAFLNYIVQYLQRAGVTLLNSSYSKTLKNSQVSLFYESQGFTVTMEKDGKKNYCVELKDYQLTRNDSIQINT